jgi:hypothetical protein
MNPHSLPDLAVFDPTRLAQARRQLISAVLWPARVAASFAANPNAPSAALTWNNDRQAVTTPPFEQALQLELRVPMLHMQFLEHGRPAPHVLDMDDRSPAHVEAWILVELLHRGVDRERFSKALPFEVQNAMWGDHEKFSTADYEAEIGALSHWLVAGAEVLGEIAPGAAITVQPQTLSLAAPMTLKRGDGSSEPRLVVFSLGEGATAEPQFAVTRETNGTVTPLRPETVLAASRVRREAMNPAAIARVLEGGNSAAGAV